MAASMHRIPISDFENFANLFPDWCGSFVQISRGRFEGTMLVGRSQTMHAHYATTNQSIHVRGRERTGVMSIALVVPANANSRWQGRQLDPGRIVIRGGNVEANHFACRDAVNIQLSFSEERFRKTVIDEIGDDPGSTGWQSVPTSPESFRALEMAIHRFLRDSSTESGVEDREQACLVAAIDALFPSTKRTGFYRLPGSARSALARRAEDSMRDRLGESVTERDLCRELRVCGRTLRLAFHEWIGMGPMAYFQTLRLNAVRSALVLPERRTVSVAEAAREKGFHHLGKFAGYYRRLFGERPSETVMRVRQPRRV